MRVLIVLPGAIGDVVRGLPLLGRLRTAWPTAHLAWAVEPASAALLDGHPWLDERIVIDRTSLRAFGATLRRVRDGRFDLALDLGRGIRSGLLVAATGASRRVGFHRRDGREGSWLFATERLPYQGVARAKLDQFQAFGDRLGLPASPIAFGLVPSADAEQAAAALLPPGPFVGASLGSSCPSRRWFPADTARVLRTLEEQQGLRAVLLGTAADAAFARDVLAVHPGAIDLTSQTTLPVLIALLRRLRLVIGPDSGALHLAAAMGTRVVSLWGATSALRSAPWGSERWVIEGESPCRPCFLRDCPIDRRCMRAITDVRVVATVREALAA